MASYKKNFMRYGFLAATVALAAVASAEANHLVLSEVGLYPNTQDPISAEFVEIYNPTRAAISLDNYYISDSNLYVRLPSGPDGQVDTATTDQILRFPAGYTLQPGQVAVVTGGAVPFNSDFFSSSTSPFDGSSSAPLLFEVTDTDANVPNMVSSNSNLTAPLNFNLTNASGTNGEFAVLFYWDGIADIVRDVDIVTWGTVASGQNMFAPKSSASGYLKDSGSHASMSVTSSGGDVLVRTSTVESSETSAGGNGLTGHDETTEQPGSWTYFSGRTSNMTPGTTGLTTNSENIPPLVDNVTRNIKNPAVTDPIVLSAEVADLDGTIASVYFFVNTGSGFTSMAATAAGGKYSVTVPALGQAGVLQYYVVATDNESAVSTQPNAGASSPIIVQIGTPPPTDSVVINETQFDIIGTDSTEWLELYNLNNTPVSLAGWRAGNSTEKYFQFPADAVIAPHGYLILTYAEPALRSLYPDIPNDVPVYTYPFSQANGGDTLWLAQANEFNFDGSNITRFDEVAYSKSEPWPTINPNVTGQSFELDRPTLDNNNGANWTAHPPVVVEGVAKNSGTPGAMNYKLAAVSDWSVY